MQKEKKRIRKDKIKRYSRCLAASLSVGMLFLSACSLLPQEEQLPAAPVLQKNDGSSYEIVEVVRGDLIVTDTILCTYQAKEEVRLFFDDASAVADRFYVSVGDSVSVGDLIAEADNEALSESMAETEREYQNERLEQTHLEETLSLWKERLDILSRALQDEASSEESSFENAYQETSESIRQQTQAIERQKERVRIVSDRLDELKTQYAATQVRATISGTVTSLNEGAKAGSWVCEISDFSEAYFQAETAQAMEIGQTEEVFVTGMAEPYTTTVVACEATGSGKYSVLLQLDEADLTLQSGRSGSIERIAEAYRDVLYLPQSVITKSDGTYYVYYLDENDIRRRKAVTVGDTVNTMTIILDGLEEGEQVIR
jgi:multidrug efflux pump subunit AcrA (membrane-fusion protein)